MYEMYDNRKLCVECRVVDPNAIRVGIVGRTYPDPAFINIIEWTIFGNFIQKSLKSQKKFLISPHTVLAASRSILCALKNIIHHFSYITLP